MKLLICPLDYSGDGKVSHTGLHISSLNTAKVLHSAGLDVQVRPIVGAFKPLKPTLKGALLDNLVQQLNPTHVVTCAFWMPPADMRALCLKYPDVEFAVNCHSNIAFLQVEPGGLAMLRQYVDLEICTLNFHVTGNCRDFVTAILGSWRAPCGYLPNLYYLDGLTPTHQRIMPGGTIRIGEFGALRPFKNHTVGAWAALGIAGALNTNVEFYINTRDDGGGQRILQSLHSIMDGLPYAKLITIPWQPWPDHRRTVRHMHLLIQPSFTETFLLVAADAVAEGTPVVGSNVIEWLPAHWQADPDDVEDVVRVGLQLLNDQRAQFQGVQALRRNNDSGVTAWKVYLGVM